MNLSSQKIVLAGLILVFSVSNPMFGMLRLGRQIYRNALPALNKKLQFPGIKTAVKQQPKLSFSLPITANRNNWRYSYSANKFRPYWWAAALPIGCSAFALAQLYKKSEKQKPMAPAKPWDAVEKKYKKMLEDEEQMYWNELLSLTGKTKEELHALFKFGGTDEEFLSDIQTKIKNSKPVDTNIIQTIREVCSQYNHDPSSITIIDSGSTSIMELNWCPTKNLLVIDVNQNTFANRPLDQIAAFAHHEMAHIKNRDSLNLGKMEKFFLSEPTKISSQSAEIISVIYQLSRFREARADIGAGLFHPAVCNSFVEFFKPDSVELVNGNSQLIYNGRGMSSPTHPHHWNRYVYLTQLYNEMIACLSAHELEKQQLKTMPQVQGAWHVTYRPFIHVIA